MSKTIINKFFELIWTIKEYFLYWIRPLQLDIHISEHCNLNCISCTNFSPLAHPKFADLKELDNNLKYLSKFQKSFGVLQLMGGEPLLNPNIIDIIKISRKYFSKTSIKILTNGILLKSMKDDFWRACREYDINISVTIYPININVMEIEKICDNNKVRFEIFAIRTGEKAFYAYKVNPNGGQKVFMKFIKCQSSGCMQIVENKIFACPISADIKHLNSAFGYDFKQKRRDYVRIDKMKTAFQLRWLRARSKPFCYYCELRGNSFPWRKSEKKEEEWVKY
ncbi:MAG: radical SAM protein [Erysipelotrichales bacterium]|nr:radical SAM protein [Erysipelotrichales bacterium]